MPLLYIFVSLVLFILIFLWINYLTANQLIVECFTNNVINESNKTNHTVNLPLTSTHKCNNFCGPTARCSVTGQQCLSDFDCPGCQ